MRVRRAGRRSSVVALPLALATAATCTALGVPAVPASGATPSAASAAGIRTSAPVVGTVDRANRAAVLAAYRANFLAPSTVTGSWSGSVRSCDAGSTDPAFTRATLSAINWARSQAGMPPVVGVNPTYSARAQRTALLMQARGALSHAPASSWACWSSDGAAGAAHSNLALGVTGARAVGTYLIDPGSTNSDAGHRRWLLYPRLGQIGIGNTGWANAVYVVGSPARLPAGVPAYYGWPTSGYFPRGAEPRGLWSLSSSRGFSFARATVRVIGPTGAAVRVTCYPSHNGYGDNTLVWRLASAPSQRARADQTYRVTVTGIRTATGHVTSYSYAVILVS